MLAAVAAALAISGSAQAQSSLPSPRGGEASITPRVLSAADVRRYRNIFQDERAGRFAHAKKLIAELSDRCLMGYVEAEHLLSPHSGHSRPAQLNGWLRDYGDLSIADRIRALSKRRTAKKGRIPPPPPVRWRGGGYEDPDLPDPPLMSTSARAVEPQINTAIRTDQPDAAQALLQTLAADSSVPLGDIARLSQHVAASFLAEGQDRQAYDLAAPMADTARQIVPLLDWSAGLAAFRMGQYDDAAEHFETLATAGSLPSWTRAAAAFWAARSNMQARKPRQVISLLIAAAREEPTFYGLLAERILGHEPDSEFRNPSLTTAGLDALMQVAAARRALALWQVDERDYVPNEMNRAFASIGTSNSSDFAGLAEYMVLPNLELRASETEASRGIMLTGLFPVPKYSPDGGYTVDPSVVLAIARIESRFEPSAVSGAGARGLMQLMPATARHVAGGLVSDDALETPSYNLALGQRYVGELLRRVNGNLFQLAAAYNAGPTNLSRWLAARDDTHDDPLLFIESVPSPETRSYIKRFMMYHWLYSRRLDQDSPTLDEAASGGWPVYHPRNVPVASVPAAMRSFNAASD